MGRIVGLLLLSALLTGCTSAIVGGSARGGYGDSSDGRTRLQVTDDAAISSRVNAKLVNDSSIGNYDIDVSTRLGVVTLSGSVPGHIARRAVDLAGSTRGVERVISQLR